jgi:hypothetical protein
VTITSGSLIAFPHSEIVKNCLSCGAENADDTAHCTTCGTGTFVGSPYETAGGHTILPAEKSFWDHMDFHQCAVVIIRVEALWLLFNALLLATHLPPYFDVVGGSLSVVPGLEFSMSLDVLRIVLSVAVAIVCFKYSARIVRWFFHDLIKPS